MKLFNEREGDVRGFISTAKKEKAREREQGRERKKKIVMVFGGQ